MHVKKKLISLLLALGMLGGTQTALAAEPAAQEAAPLPAWSYGMLADGYSLGLFGDEIYTQHSQTVTAEQLDTMTKVVADKLALLEMETRPAAEEAWSSTPPGAAWSTPCTRRRPPTPSPASRRGRRSL